MLRFAAAGSWHQKKKSAVELPRGIICSNVERKNKFKRFEGAVSKIFIVALHQMTMKHLQDAGNCPGVEVLWLSELSFRLVGCFGAKSPHPVK